MKNRKNLIVTCSLLIVSLALTIFLGIYFGSFSKYEVKFYSDEKGYVQEIHTLSEFSPKLSGVGATTEIYVLYDKDGFSSADFDEKGNLKPEVVKNSPSALVLGGTHPNEPSGQLAATMLLENAVVEGKSVLFIINETNKSAYTHSHPQEASPQYYELETKDGSKRTFKFGSRATNTNEQWPNPDVYTGLAGQKLSSNDARNLNRSYPGKVDGTYSERVAYGITTLIKTYDIKLTIDLHEASPEYKTINAIISHENAVYTSNYAISWILGMIDPIMTDGLTAEPSDPTLRGLTHRELGDYTNTICVICETSNASQGKIRGEFTEELITDGTVDKFYNKALEVSNERVEKGLDKIIYGKPQTIEVRVARHLSCILALLAGYNGNTEDTFALKVAYDEKEGKCTEDETLINARESFLKSCGKFEVSLDLARWSGVQFDEYNPANYEIIDDMTIEIISEMFDKICHYGVGSFLAPENLCK